MNALLYIRVSTEEQVKYGYSLEAQEQALRQWCDNNNCTVKKVYADEGISGGSVEKRKALQKMISDSLEGEIIIFTKLDRFSRNLLDANIIVKELDTKGVGIKAINEDDIDTTTADGRFIFNLKLSLAQREREKTSERIRDVFAYKVSVGEVTTGAVPVGYKIENKHLVINEETKDIPLFVFETFDRTSNKLQTRDLLFAQKGVYYDHNHIGRILSNQKYIGRHKGNDNYCEPLIDIKLFNRVQDKLSQNVKRTPTKANYIFSRLIVCPFCKGHLFGYTGKTTKNIYHYYRCRNNSASRMHSCNFRTVREDRIEKELIEKMPIFASKEKHELKKRSDNIDVEGNIAALNAKIERTNELYIEGMIDKESYNNKVNQFKKELNEYQSMAESVDTKILDQIIEMDVKEIYYKLTEENKSIFWHRFVKGIIISEDGHVEDIDFYND